VRPAPSGTATGVTISISRDPSLVRTVRLVAAAVARSASFDQDVVEEIRLAVGEACALLIGATPKAEEASEDLRTGPVEVRMTLTDRLRVVVSARGGVALDDSLTSDIDGIEPWALLRGLIEDFAISVDTEGTVLSMSWPVT
jgi:anti-sigma regulatory factor (Ser/Thr protein kinase)